MTQPAITREDSPTGGRYVAAVDGGEERAELTYSRIGPGSISANHTGVPDALRGQGVGRLVVQRMVADARAEGFKIRVGCSFVAAERRKHPEWADAFQD
jgi:predicted GNAT family acetyltransferase